MSATSSWVNEVAGTAVATARIIGLLIADLPARTHRCRTVSARVTSRHHQELLSGSWRPWLITRGRLTEGLPLEFPGRTDSRVIGLIRSRRDLDPHLRAGRSGRIIGTGAWTVIPVRLRLAVLHHDRRGLHHDLRRRIVVRRIAPPPRSPPERGPNHDDAVTVESMVPVEPVASVAPMATPRV